MTTTHVLCLVLVATSSAGCRKKSELEELEGRCESGHANSCGQLADRLRSAAPERAAALYARACEGGDEGGCFSLARVYLLGQGVQRNPERALALLDEQCQRDGVVSCHELATLLEEGDQVPRDEARAAEAYRRACPGPYLPACYALGRLYEEGRGVPRSSSLAAAFYLKSCGDAAACDVREHARALADAGT